MDQNGGVGGGAGVCGWLFFGIFWHAPQSSEHAAPGWAGGGGFMSYRTAADLSQHSEDPHKTAILAKEERLFRNNKDRPGEGLWSSSEVSWGLLGCLGGSLEVLRGFMGSPNLGIQ